MNLTDHIKLHEVHAQPAAGTGSTSAAPRSADEEIKKILDDKQKRLNDMRQKLIRVSDQVKAAVALGKKIIEQDLTKVPGTGDWLVMDPMGLLLSKWPTEEEARRAAYANWETERPSSTGATAGARVIKKSVWKLQYGGAR